jgi:hypothetical protein
VFFLRTSHQNENKQSAITLRIIFQKERRDMLTGLYCFEKDWDREGTRVKSSDERSKTLNENLAMILHSAKNSYDEIRFSRPDVYYSGIDGLADLLLLWIGKNILGDRFPLDCF